MTTRWALATDVGLSRDNNEDSAIALPELDLFAVADGMGGHVAGEVASNVAIQTVIDAVQSSSSAENVGDEESLLAAAICAANDSVVREAEARNLLGMGTTLTVARIRGRTAVISHVGDTRAYLVTRDEIRQLTTDHTVVALLVAAGKVAAEDAHIHPGGHVLTRAIGTQATIEPENTNARIPTGSRLLLSSDGLHDVISDAQIHALATQSDLAAAARALIDAANREGGPDNITALLVEP
jgi:protein phosphatase